MSEKTGSLPGFERGDEDLLRQLQEIDTKLNNKEEAIRKELTDEEEAREIEERVEHIFYNWQIKGYPKEHLMRELASTIEFYEDPSPKEGVMGEMAYKACKEALRRLEEEVVGENEN